ncbi:MAG: type II toxin-antitoxin system RelE/ParE family toxin [Flavobacteriales bacterium]
MKPFEIIWSHHAENELDKIYKYYAEVASDSIAKKILQDLISEPNKLRVNPQLGQCEEWLFDRSVEYRYLLFRQFKLIYTIDFNMNYIKMADVFDSRQDPQRMKRNL